MLKAHLRRILGDNGVKLFKKLTGRFQFDESRLIHEVFKDRPQGGVMIDVGAHFGTELAMFASSGWKVLAFEPDIENRKHLEASFGSSPNVIIDTRAVAEVAGEELAFFTSDVSTGISGLSAFHESHSQTQTVTTTSISEISKDHKLSSIDFLKIDVEGFDFSVIKGIDWDGLTPDVILCEFEDAKTRPLGHSSNDVFNYLLERGYCVTISEWRPISEYGQSHNWKGFCKRPKELDPNGWGNMIAFRDRPEFAELALANIEKLARRVFPKQFKSP